MSLPPAGYLRQLDAHRLIPSQYSPDEVSVLVRIADGDTHLQGLFELDNITNDRLRGEADLLPGIGRDELVFGVPYGSIVNAVFIHAHPLGSRFNDPDRGAWYAGFELETSQAEIAWHKSVELAEIDWFEESVTYDDYLADFGGDYHDLREAPEFAGCLALECYRTSQALSEQFLEAGANGVVYPSVRRSGGSCLACFRPALVGNVRRAARYRFTWSGTPEPQITREERFP